MQCLKAPTFLQHPHRLQIGQREAPLHRANGADAKSVQRAYIPHLFFRRCKLSEPIDYPCAVILQREDAMEPRMDPAVELVVCTV